ncbi:hypothetical protein [Amylibacter sp. SFDW26]|uniref:tetratricopeptide repeat protein n=1 Tax=Amylibacter sp. SFDW26 TaxID=2652722 RepID=UPI001D01F1A0|nr:hypothetical protein [Amylibacter sp. SFDW26]
MIPLVLCVNTAYACSEIADRNDERAMLLQNLKDADTYRKGQASIAGMWMFWQQAPDETAQELLDTGLSRLRISDYIAAEDAFARLVDYCPDYAEGHNQLAFAYFLQDKLEASSDSLDRTLELEPQHFGALAGKGLVFIKQGRNDIAQIFLRRAQKVNPWLNERGLIKPVPGQGEL